MMAVSPQHVAVANRYILLREDLLLHFALPLLSPFCCCCTIALRCRCHTNRYYGLALVRSVPAVYNSCKNIYLGSGIIAGLVRKPQISSFLNVASVSPEGLITVVMRMICSALNVKKTSELTVIVHPRAQNREHTEGEISADRKLPR